MTPVQALAIGASVDSVIDVEAVDEAARHGLVGLLHHHVEAGGTATRDARRRLGIAHLAARLRLDQATATLDESAERLDGIVDWALIKGLSVADRWYPDVLARTSLDIDIWIDPRDPDGMADAVSALGAPERRASVRLMSSTGRVFSEVVTVQHVNVDVHADAMSLLLPALHSAALWEHQLTETTVQGRRVVVPTLELAIVIAAVNASRDGFPSWRQVADLRFMMDARPDWDRVSELCDREGWTPIVSNALEVVAREAGRSNPMPPSRASATAMRLFWRQPLFRGIASTADMRRRQSLVSTVVNRRRRTLAMSFGRRIVPERAVIDHRTGGRYRHLAYPLALLQWRRDQRRHYTGLAR